jgi:hypothetical protein
MMHEWSHLKATIHIYSHKKFQKIHKRYAFTTTCQKTKRAILTLLALQENQAFMTAIYDCG